ncbi:hypothetical protein Tco_1228488 [Tanacetum coccineum]
MERKINEWEKSQNVSLEQTDWTEPQPPPQAQTELVNAVFTGSGKSDDSLKIQKDPPPSIIVNNKIKKDRPLKTSKGNYHVVKTEEYSFRSLEDTTDPSSRIYTLWEANTKERKDFYLKLKMCAALITLCAALSFEAKTAALIILCSALSPKV